jgi:hypothetical protein
LNFASIARSHTPLIPARLSGTLPPSPQVKALCAKAMEILMEESNVQRVDAPVTVRKYPPPMPHLVFASSLSRADLCDASLFFPLSPIASDLR